LIHRIDRRTFLRRSAIAAAGAAVVGLGVNDYLRERAVPWDRDAFAPPGEARVAVLRATSYQRELEGVVLDGLRAIGAEVRGASVLLKPNFVEYDTETVVNTDPRLVAATVLAMRRLGASEVTVAEGPGHRRDTQYVVTSSGLLDHLKAVDAPFVDLNTDAIVARRLRSHYTSLGSIWLPASVVEADVVVSMAKMKTHHWTGVTLSLKNCFGCIPGRVYGWPKNALHWAGIQRSILDVAGAVRPALAIVDGIVGMEGNGPISGTPVRSGVLVFGDDPVAADVTAATLMNLDPTRVPYLAEAGRFLGQADRDRIRQEGEDPDRDVTDFTLLPQFTYLKVGSTAEPVNPLSPPAF
jgi:uncharacterized protein (DUF362 family)